MQEIKRERGREREAFSTLRARQALGCASKFLGELVLTLYLDSTGVD